MLMFSFSFSFTFGRFCSLIGICNLGIFCIDRLTDIIRLHEQTTDISAFGVMLAIFLSIHSCTLPATHNFLRQLPSYESRVFLLTFCLLELV